MRTCAPLGFLKRAIPAVVLAIFFATPRFSAQAVEIKGTVRSATADAATIAIEGESAPNAGDPVEIYFKLPGADTEISVGRGKVTAVRGDSVEAKIDKATGTVAKDQLARITSQKPQKRTAIAASPGASWIEESRTKYDQGDFDGAIALCTKAIETNPNDAKIYYQLGVCYARKSDWAMAMDDLSRAISMNPNFAKPYNERAYVRISQQDFGPALLDDCNKAIALDGNLAQAYLRRGIYYAHEGNMKLAEADWKKAIALDPHNEDLVKQNRAFYGPSRPEPTP